MLTLDTIRDAGERDIEALLKNLDDRHKALLRDAITKYGVNNVPESVWGEVQQNMEESTVAAILLLLMMADDWTTTEIEQAGAGRSRISDAQLNEYKRTAARHSRELSLQTTSTLRDRLTRKVQDQALTGPGEIGTATDMGVDVALDDVFTQSRRETIAIDTTTTAMSAGQRAAAERAKEALGGDGTAAADGIKTTIALIWRTEKDYLVCPRCSPLEGQPEEVWGRVFPLGPGPACHPNCRCELDIRVVLAAE